MQEEIEKIIPAKDKLYRSISDEVLVYNFKLQRIIQEKEFITITGEANVHITYPQTALDATERLNIVELKTLPKREARELILDYITRHHGAKTSDIIFDLAIEVDLVLEILEELRKENEIEPVDIKW